MRAAEIHAKLRQLQRWGSVYIPEFTYGSMRIDAAIVDIQKRWIRGFEIKVSRSDFLSDDKWHAYSEFCSSLSVVCPTGLIRPEEIPGPFGLLYIKEKDDARVDYYGRYSEWYWAKKPKRFQRRDGLAWTYTYLSVIEKELPRLVGELEQLKRQMSSELQRPASDVELLNLEP